MSVGERASAPEIHTPTQGGGLSRLPRRSTLPENVCPVGVDLGTILARGALSLGGTHVPLGAEAVSWRPDERKLARVRALMAEEDVDALVVRAPDNVLYQIGRASCRERV